MPLPAAGATAAGKRTRLPSAASAAAPGVLRRGAKEIRDRHVELQSAVASEAAKQAKLLALVDNLTPDTAAPLLPSLKRKLEESRARQSQLDLLLAECVEKESALVQHLRALDG